MAPAPHEASFGRIQHSVNVTEAAATFNAEN
jgi:hypothetical protein